MEVKDVYAALDAAAKSLYERFGVSLLDCGEHCGSENVKEFLSEEYGLGDDSEQVRAIASNQELFEQWWTAEQRQWWCYAKGADNYETLCDYISWKYERICVGVKRAFEKGESL